MSEQSFTSSANSENTGVQVAPLQRSRLPAPIWRLRRVLQPIIMVRTIKTRVIPKLVLALRIAPSPPEVAEPQSSNPIPQFAALALGDDEAAASTFVKNRMAEGMSVESVFIDLLAPTAQHFGELWESDATDFASVTVAVGRLQMIMRQLSEAFSDQKPYSEGGETALLTTIPGEQHSFGLSMVAEFFRRAGWNLCTGPFSSHQELCSIVHNHWFDIIGFSVSSDRRLEELKRDIHNIRRDSRNRNVGIILGGPMMALDPSLVVSMGADMLSLDATTAPQQAHDLIELKKK